MEEIKTYYDKNETIVKEIYYELKGDIKGRYVKFYSSGEIEKVRYYEYEIIKCTDFHKNND